MFVNFLEKYKPFYAPDDEIGGDPGETPEVVDTGADTGTEPADGPGSGRSAIRKSLEKGFKDGHAAEAVAEKGRKPLSKRAGDRIGGGVNAGGTGDPEETPEDVETDGQTEPQTAAPEAFSKEAKAEWAKVPSTVQAAILKRETDVAKGVEELKGRYKDIDSALAPHMNAIRQHGHSPAQAVNQLFAWFQALGTNPDVAFPALAKSFGWDPTKVTSGAAPAAAAGAEGQPAVEIPPALQEYITKMQTEVAQLKQSFGQELTGLKSTFQQQSEAKTNEILAGWAKDKPHFEAVRQLMAQLIQSGAVPLKEGQVDLDGAYEMAMYANPQIRATVLAEQQKAAQAARKAKAEADKKAQDEANAKARRAGTSLGGGAPGDASGAQPSKRGKGMSVRDSIRAAREELSS